MIRIFPSRSNALVERTLSWLTLKAGLLTLKFECNPKLYYSVLGMFDQFVQPMHDPAPTPKFAGLLQTIGGDRG